MSNNMNNFDNLLQDINNNMNDILLFIDNTITYENHICFINLDQKYIDLIENLLFNNKDIIDEINKSYNITDEYIRYKKTYNYIIFKYYNKLHENYNNNQLLKDKYNNYNDYFIFYYNHFINKYKFNISFSLDLYIYDVNYCMLNSSKWDYKTFINVNYKEYYNLYHLFIKHKVHNELSILKHIFVNNSYDILLYHNINIFYFLDLIKP